MDATGPPIEASDDDHSSGSRASLLGLPPFFARQRGTRSPSIWRVEHALSWGSCDLASSTQKKKGKTEVVKSGASSSDVASWSAFASWLGSPERRKVDMDRRRGRGGDGMTEVVRAGGTAICGAAYRGVIAASKVVAVMDLFSYKPM